MVHPALFSLDFKFKHGMETTLIALVDSIDVDWTTPVWNSDGTIVIILFDFLADLNMPNQYIFLECSVLQRFSSFLS